MNEILKEYLKQIEHLRNRQQEDLNLSNFIYFMAN